MENSEFVKKFDKETKKILNKLIYLLIIFWLIGFTIAVSTSEKKAMEVVSKITPTMVLALIVGFCGILIFYFLRNQMFLLELHRLELIKSTKILNTQTELEHLEKFENRFFQQLNLHQNLINSISENWQHKSPAVVVKGRDLFLNTAQHIYNKYKVKLYEKTGKEKETLLKFYIEDVYNFHKSALSLYFRSLYYAIKYVDESTELEISSEKNSQIKSTYINIIKAQLSSNELLILAYHSLTWYGQAFKPFIEKYQLLTNIDFNNYVADSEMLINEFPQLKSVYEEYKLHS